MNLAAIDLNLLVVFDALMTERNVTKAGANIGLSQSAVSKALNRLRLIFDDELFVRTSAGMQPTALAYDLADPIGEALHTLEQALNPPKFDPAVARRIFTLTTVDLVSSVIIPRVLNHLEKHAPGIDLRLLPSTGRSIEMLDRREVDFALVPLEEIPSRFESTALFSDDFAVLMRDSHPLSQQELTLERLVSARHVLVSLRGDDRSAIDDALEARGLSRRIGITINQFLAGPPIVAGSDLIMIAPKSLCRAQASLYNLTICPLPLVVPEMNTNLNLIWARRDSNNPASAWMRSVIQQYVNRNSHTE